RSTVMAARTLLQQALVTTFGLKVAGWLAGIIEARAMLAAIHDHRLVLQFGGAVGTLASLADRGPEVARELAAELGFWEPLLPWHTARSRVVELASALAITAGVAGKVALDVVLLAQTEVGEVSEGWSTGRGGSSTLPQKQNPVNAIEILAAVRGVNAQASALLATMLQEHERAAGAWQAEWQAVSETLRLTGGAAHRLADLLEGLEVDSERMRRNLGQSGGRIMSEHVVMVLGERVDPRTARKLVDAAVSKSTTSGRPFTEVVLEDPAITAHLTREQLASALDPYSYLGASDQLIDRTLGAYREQTRQVRRRLKAET
ncbi:MAG TPA: lyase family protein, partial [Candidatus Dormibacteraeota bacterium]|nr:lyase family protein [Candidatus Dormibacteraeota bacterium]